MCRYFRHCLYRLHIIFTKYYVPPLNLHIDPTGCEEGSLRLVDGDIDNEGRVEVCLDGVWGTIDGRDGWSSADAYFVCNQLKLGTFKSQHNEIACLHNVWYICLHHPIWLYTSGPEVYTTASKFGDGLQPQVMYNPTCSGFESKLTDCEFSRYSGYLSREYTAGVLCFDGRLGKKIHI